MGTLSNRQIHNLAQDFNELLWSGPTTSDSQNTNRLIKTNQHNSMWGPLVYHSPLTMTEESSDLAKGITGTTIGKKRNDQGIAKDILPTLHLKGHGRRKIQPDNVKIKITIKNRLIRGHCTGSKGQPMEYFKVTPLNNKSHK